MSKKSLYRISFANQDDIYEIYARQIHESDIFGFIEVEEFVFGETTSLVVDPSEERLKVEFSDVKRTFIPMQSIFRIDEVDKQGVSKVKEKSKDGGTVSMFPLRDKRKD
ncbi:MAG: DUF1820 family protein [Proteobacteria bacterium]|nr:DUF1820 family protein [Pseudomonadota bacterium]